MRHGKQRVMGAAGAVALAMTCVGCATADARGEAPTTPATASLVATASATPTRSVPPKPALPQAATEHTDAGAIAFTEHWFAVLSYAYASGDTDAIWEISNKETCEGCKALAERIQSRYANDGYMTDGNIEVKSTGVLPYRENDATVLVVNISQEEIQVHENGSIAPTRSDKQSDGSLLVYTRLSPGGWELEHLKANMTERS